MAIPIPNTTLDDTDWAEFAGGDLLAGGFFVVANNPAEVQLFVRAEGALVAPGPSLYLPPGTYPIARGQKQPVAGVRARNAVAGSVCQFFGVLYYPGEAQVLSGSAFEATVAPGGGVTPPGGAGAVELIEKKTLLAPAADLDFTGIPSTYSHLVWIGQARGTTAATSTSLFCQVNGDTGANYDYEYSVVQGAATLTPNEVYGSTAGLYAGLIPAATAIAAVAAALEGSIPNYTATVFQKNARARSSVKVANAAAGNNARNDDVGSFWRSAVAVNRLRFYTPAGQLDTGSTISLYGWT